MSLFEKRVEAAAREIWKADNTTLGIDPPESMGVWVEETEGYLELAREVLLAADAVVTEEMIAEELAGYPIGSGFYQTSVGVVEAREMADLILALFRGGAK